MGGIYVHIPFCRQACHYCDFHFSTNLLKQAEIVKAICEELATRKNYLPSLVDTIYFGGGTPSLLSASQFNKLLEVIHKNYQVAYAPEITLEANPEDLLPEKIKELNAIGINRLSIGVQTFSDDWLKWMNRAHNVRQSMDAYYNARSGGFNNISLDLIYAIPGYHQNGLYRDLERAVELRPEHISLYSLTIEENTVFGRRKQEGKLKELNEEHAADRFLEAIDSLKSAGYTQYEVSNFCRLGFESKHNAAYWSGEHYLGVGPSAHSYNGNSRQWNIKNNAKYLAAIAKQEIHYELEQLSQAQQFNEKILTGLRTKAGLNLKHLHEQYDTIFLSELRREIDKLVHQQLIQVSENHLSLTSKGLLLADEIALKFFTLSSQ